MTEWFLIWFLIVEKYNGDIDERGPFTLPKATHVECLYEAKAKADDLTQQLGSEAYIRYDIQDQAIDGIEETLGTGLTPYYTVRYGGKLTGFRVGCESSDK